MRNAKPANLYLMNRADLHSAFTKINLWKQTQFRKIVYVDADVVAYRAVDELFDLSEPFSAAPDVGWPDIFNTGVMVLTPNMGDYYAMLAMSERGISFDGADQGLLNMHFKNNYNRLSFAYNVTPSAHYSYVPAYRHFQSSINMVHFIGSEKPWAQGRSASAEGDNPYGEMLGRWWAVYDRHYRQPVRSSSNRAFFDILTSHSSLHHQARHRSPRRKRSSIKCPRLSSILSRANSNRRLRRTLCRLANHHSTKVDLQTTRILMRQHPLVLIKSMMASTSLSNPILSILFPFCRLVMRGRTLRPEQSRFQGPRPGRLRFPMSSRSTSLSHPQWSPAGTLRGQ